ncbi:hypothetical protein PUN28_017569 [Cardiocondyla obscurior]|uniref:Uncharacterized protein n=1 Tax=Cardiocondyla obscurior TaxID=286306 RepID=A0AAW2EI42_9HYME
MENVELSRSFRYRIYNNPYEPKPRKPIDSYIKRLGLQCNRQLFQHLHIHNTTYSLQKKKISWKKNTKKNQWWNIKKKIYIFVISLLLIYLFWSCSFELCKKIFEYKSEAAYSSKESMKHCCTIAFRILE